MDELKKMGRQIHKHVLIATGISFGVMLLIWTIMLGFQQLFEDESLNTPHIGAVFLGGAFFAIASMLLLSLVMRFLPSAGLLGLAVFILAIIFERFVLIKVVRIELALLFLVYFNFSWLVLLGLNTYLKSSND